MARAALQIGVRELGNLADVSPTTVSRFERDGKPNPYTVAAIRAALEASGIIFIDGNGEGPGVRLQKDVRSKRA